MNPARLIVRKAVPFRLRKAIGERAYRLRGTWLTRSANARRGLTSRRLTAPIVPAGSPRQPLAFPIFEHPRVSIVIPAHNHWSYTYRCLSAVLEHSPEPTYEVILADDRSTDQTIHARSLLGNVTVIRDGKQRGYVKNCNHAAQHARGEYIVLLNNDTVVQPGWLSSLVGTAERDSQVGIVGAKIIYDDGRLQEAGGFVSRDGIATRFGQNDNPSAIAYNSEMDVDYVSGCCLLMRRDLWQGVGGFDVRFSPGYYEDVDLAFRVREHGYRVVYQPSAVVAHTEGVSHGQDPTTGPKRHLERNARMFRTRWEHVLDSGSND